MPMANIKKEQKIYLIAYRISRCITGEDIS